MSKYNQDDLCIAAYVDKLATDLSDEARRCLLLETPTNRARYTIESVDELCELKLMDEETACATDLGQEVAARLRKTA